MDSASIQFVLFGLVVACFSNLSRSRALFLSVPLSRQPCKLLGLLSHSLVAFLSLALLLFYGLCGPIPHRTLSNRLALWS